jgi:murein DD-endopeptidase MepM/ murein hydrolase activator NlpD
VGPEGTVAPYAERESSSGQIALHVVREGESLSVIASLYQVSVNTILWANDIKDASTIQPGDSLLILPVSGVQHKIAKGETLASIAKKYGADAEEIRAFNGLEEGVALASGQTLIIPGGDLAPKKADAPKKSSGSAGTVAKKPSSSVTLGDWANPVPGAYVSQGVHGYNGVDLAGIPNGTPVYAAQSGTVIVAKSGGGYNGGYGNYIVVSHANGTQTLYAHLSSVAVAVGESVERGENIGGVGNTGRSTGNHLHFEVRGGVNPFAH